MIFRMIDSIASGRVAFYVTLNRKPEPHLMVMPIRMKAQRVLSHGAFKVQFEELNPVDPGE